MHKKRTHKSAKRGFTFVELIIVITIISTILAIVLTFVFAKPQKKAAVNAYKTAMHSVQFSVAECSLTGGQTQAGLSGEKVCSAGDGLYPALTKKCNSSAPFFSVSNPTSDEWEVTTQRSRLGGPWACQGCRALCDIEKCIFLEEEAGNCYL